MKPAPAVGQLQDEYALPSAQPAAPEPGASPAAPSAPAEAAAPTATGPGGLIRPRLRNGQTTSGEPSWVPRRGRWEGSVNLRADYSNIDTKGPDTRTTTKTRLTEERLNIYNRGIYVLSPQLLTMDVGLSFGLNQDRIDSTVDNSSSSKERGDGTLLGYEFLATALPGRRVSLDLMAYRNESSSVMDFGADTDLLYETYGTALRMPYLALPSVFSYRHEHNDAETRGLNVTRQEERRNIIEYRGERGWENKDLSIYYEFIDKDDLVDSDLSTDTHRVYLNFGADTGVELNRHWDSWLRLYNQSGFASEDRLDFEQNLRVDHTDTLRSRYRYYLSHSDRPEVDSTSQTLAAYLNYQLRDNLFSEVGLEGERNRTTGTDRDVYRTKGRADYRKNLPASGRLFLGVSDIFEWEKDQFSQAQPTVVGEPLGFGDPALAQPLANRNVTEVTEVRLSSRRGPLPPNCTPFSVPRPLVEGVDYLVQTTGNLTEIVPLPCSDTNPGIVPGDVIEVDYQFLAPSPSITFTTNSWSFLAAVEYPYVRPFYEHFARNQSLVSGVDDGFLMDERRDRYGVEFRLDRTPYYGTARLERESYYSTDLAYDTNRIGGFAAMPVGSRSRISLSAENGSSEYSDPQGRETRFFSARATLTTAFERGLFVDTYLARRKLEDTLVPDEDLDEAGVQIRWRMGKFTLRSNMRYLIWTQGDVDTDDWRVTVQVERRF